MKRLVSILLSLFVSASIVSAQPADEAPKMSVRSFVMAENDNTANFYGTTVIDQNGDPCALIRVQTTQTGFAWDFGHMAPCKVEQKTGEIWVYVPYGVKRVTVRHAQLGTMTYEFPIPVAKARTYVMDLVAANVVVLVEQEITQQWVVFKLDPPTAFVYLDGQLLETRNGMAKKFVPFGKYSYTVKAKNYHTLTGEIEVRGGQGSVTVDVALDPAFGYLSFGQSPELEGAVVFLDDEQIGTIPLAQAPQIPSGSHRIMLSKAKYKPCTLDIQVVDGETCLLSPKLAPNFAIVTVSSLEGAEIWANGSFLGEAPWTGNLEFDTYSFEVRKPSHRTVYRTFEFFEGYSGEIVLPQPVPVYGSLNVDCDYIAKVTLDGEPVGETPCLVSKVLVGEHKLALSAQGHATATRVVNVQDGKIEEVYVELGGAAQETKVQPQRRAEPEKREVAKKEPNPQPEKKPLPKLKKNIVKAGYGPLRLYGQGTDDVFHMHLFSTGYKHTFIRNHIGVAVGADFCYSFRNTFYGVDYTAPLISIPVDFVCRFGKFWINAGVCGVFSFPKATDRESGISIDLGYDLTDYDVPLFIDQWPLGFQMGVRYELTDRIAVGYNLTGNIFNLNNRKFLEYKGHDLEKYRLNFLSNMFYVGFLF